MMLELNENSNIQTKTIKCPEGWDEKIFYGFIVPLYETMLKYENDINIKLAKLATENTELKSKVGLIKDIV
jgi:hypothetical protein